MHEEKIIVAIIETKAEILNHIKKNINFNTIAIVMNYKSYNPASFFSSSNSLVVTSNLFSD